jgi:phosphinothricin acetyltransferase
MIIRKATLGDLEGITEIYNEAIKKTVATFDTETKKIKEQKEWFESHGQRYPIIVAEEDNRIIGWSALSKYSTRCAYSGTVELSLYVKEEYQRKGIGKSLMKRIIEEGKKSSLHIILARITDGNKTSIHLHEILGFEHVGILKEVGYKFDKYLDVYLMQKILK